MCIPPLLRSTALAPCSSIQKKTNPKGFKGCMSSVWHRRAVLSWAGVCPEKVCAHPWLLHFGVQRPRAGCISGTGREFLPSQSFELILLSLWPPVSLSPAVCEAQGADSASQTPVRFTQRGVGSQDRAGIGLSSDRTNTRSKISISLALPSTLEASPPPFSPRQGSTVQTHK